MASTTDEATSNPTQSTDAQRSSNSNTMSWAQRLTSSKKQQLPSESAPKENTSTPSSGTSHDNIPATTNTNASPTERLSMTSTLVEKSASLAGSLPSSSSSSTGHRATSDSTNTHDNDEVGVSTAASSIATDDGDDVPKSAANEQTPHPQAASKSAVNVWELRKKQMQESNASRQPPLPTNESAESSRSSDADSLAHRRASTHPSDSARTIIPSSNTHDNVNNRLRSANLPNSALVQNVKAVSQSGFRTRSASAEANARRNLAPLQDESSWPSPLEERIATQQHQEHEQQQQHATQRSENSNQDADAQRDGRSEKKKAKWIPIQVDITVKAPGRRAQSGPAHGDRRKGPADMSTGDRRSRHSSSQRTDNDQAPRKREQSMGDSAISTSTDASVETRPAFDSTTKSSDGTNTSMLDRRQAAPFVPRQGPADATASISESLRNTNLSQPTQHASPSGPIVSPRMTARQTVDIVEEDGHRPRNTSASFNSKRGRGGHVNRSFRGGQPFGGYPHQNMPRNGYPYSYGHNEQMSAGRNSNGAPEFYANDIYQPYENYNYNGYPQQPMYNYYQPMPYAYDAAYFQYDPLNTAYDRPHPFNPQLLDPPMDSVSYWVLGQIEFYMSDDNLARDAFLKEHMDDQGWVKLSMIATFKRIKALTQDIELIRGAVARSSQLELLDDRIRRRADWQRWAQSQRSTAQDGITEEEGKAFDGITPGSEPSLPQGGGASEVLSH